MLSVFHGHFLHPPWRPKIDTSHHDTHCNTAQKAIFGHFEGHFGQNGSLFWHYGVVYRVLRRILGLETCYQCSMVISCPLPEGPKSTPHTMILNTIAQKAISGHFESHFGYNGSLFGHHGVVYRVLRRILGLESCCQCSKVISCPLPKDPKSTTNTMILTVIQHKKPFLATLRAILGTMKAFLGITELFIVFCVVFWV